MKIVVITESGECAALAGWIAENALNAAELERWTLDPMPDVAEQVLDALAAQWLLTPADILIFPAGALGDELATRQAWRLHGGSVCQVQTLDAQQALTATLQITARPWCLSLARQPETSASGNVLPVMVEHRIAPTTPPGWLDSVESVDRVTAHPLLQAGRVLVVGQGRGDADAEKITALGKVLGAEVGYSRARVMNGGFDAERVIGISGHLLAPDVCIVAGASGAAANASRRWRSPSVMAIRC